MSLTSVPSQDCPAWAEAELRAVLVRTMIFVPDRMRFVEAASCAEAAIAVRTRTAIVRVTIFLTMDL
jgi:hypothetical protein